MRYLFAPVALILVFGVATCVAAQPSLIGPTGLVLTPTAETLGTAQWNAGATNIWTDSGSDESFIYANLGLLPRLEIGFTREELAEEAAETLLNAKLKIVGPLPGKLTLAAGGFDLTDQIDQSVYVVGTHDLGAGIISPHGQLTHPQVHVGLGSGRLEGLFGGVSVTYNAKTDLMAEYDGAGVNVGVRWALHPNFSVTAASLDGLGDFAANASVSSPW